MPNPVIPAANPGLPDKCPRPRWADLHDACEELCRARLLVEVLSMAICAPENDEYTALLELTRSIKEHLDAGCALVDQCRMNRETAA